MFVFLKNALRRPEVWGWIFLTGCVVLFAFLYYPTLGSYALRDWDESIYAQVAKQSVDPTAFTWLGQGIESPGNLWFEKPPLIIWLVRASFLVFGQTEFAARFWTPLFAMGILVVAYLWAKRSSKRPEAGLLAVSSLFVCYHFLLSSSTLNYDIPLAFFIALSLYAYTKVAQSQRYWYLVWISVALGVLTKNVLGLLPIPLIFIHMVITSQLRLVRTLQFWRGLAVGLLLVLPWHIVETIRFGVPFWRSYLWYHVGARFFTPLENNSGPWWYYSIVFTQIPYGIFAGLGLVYGMVQVARKHLHILLPFMAVLGITLLLTLAQTKGSSYIVLIYPALAVLIGVSVAELSQQLKPTWLRPLVPVAVCAICVVLGVQYNSYRTVKLQGAVYEDIKQIGAWSKAQSLLESLCYISLKSPESVVAAYPELVYYSGKQVEQCVVPERGFGQSILHTRTHFVYAYQNKVYVVAVRYVP